MHVSKFMSRAVVKLAVAIPQENRRFPGNQAHQEFTS